MSNEYPFEHEQKLLDALANRVAKAAEKNKGIRLSAEEVYALSLLPALTGEGGWRTDAPDLPDELTE